MDSFSWLEILFIFFTLALLFYYCFFWRKLLIFRVKNTSFSNLPLVSVIICAKNEANNLSKFLPYVLNQDYPNFEVIVVNDSSSDDSLKILNQASIHYENLRVYTFEKEKISFGKKEALEFGIGKSKSNYLILTDADCKPNSNKWLKRMVNGFSDGSDLVLGIGQYEKKSSVINKLIQLDTGFIALNYLSFAISKFPYMSVGRNVAYKKHLFYETGGFKSHYDIPSGDDDLFINQLSKNVKVNVVFSFKAQTTSVPKGNFKSFFVQKVRHVSAGIRYNLRNRIVLSTFYSLSVFWYLILPFVLYYPKHLLIILTIIVLKKIIMYSLIKRIFIKIGVRAEPSLVLIAEFYSVLIHSLAVLTTIFKSKKGKW